MNSQSIKHRISFSLRFFSFSILLLLSAKVQAQTIYKVGATGTHTTIAAAYAACSLSTQDYIIEIQADYGNTEYASASIVLGAKAGRSITIRPILGNNTCSISTTLSGPLFDINGAQNLTIDGRPGGIGTTNLLKIINAGVNAGYVAFFSGGANKNAVKYCNIQGSNSLTGSTTGGLISFKASGCNQNTIDNCTIQAIGFPKATIGVVSRFDDFGGGSNLDNTISNCNFIDFTFKGIWVDNQAATGWRILNNSFYQTAAFAPPANMEMISLGYGSGYIVSGNFIGGQAPFCAGPAYTLSPSVNTFKGINFINSLTGTINTISGNTIQNITFSTSSSAAGYPFTCISMLGAGSFTCGGSGTGNTIGSVTANNINFTNTSTGGSLGLCAIFNSSTGNISITDNTIGGIKILNGGSSGASSVIISTTNGPTIVDNNTIGSTASIIENASSALLTIINSTSANPFIVTNNKLQGINASNTSGLNGLYGIKSSGTGNISCTDNILSNINSDVNAMVSLINYTGGSSTSNTASFLTNTVHTVTLTNIGSGTNLNVFDIASPATITLDDNTIGNTSPDNIVVAGNKQCNMIYNGGAGPFSVTNNNIQNIKLTSMGAANPFIAVGNSSSSGAFTCTGNYIANIKTNTTTTLQSGCIYSGSSSTGILISQNKIDNIFFTNAANSAIINNGIYLNAGAGFGGTVSKNSITNFSNASVSTTAKMTGIELAGGNWSLQNNVIILDNMGATNNMPLYGIDLLSTGTGTVYHNTVKIAGTQSAGTSYSACINRPSIGTGTYTVKNNIFQNLRTGTNSNYSEVNIPSVGYTTNNNYGQAPVAGAYGYWISAGYNFLQWQSAPINANLSVTGNVNIDGAGKVTTAPFPGASKGASPLTPSVLDDFIGAIRPSTPWIGAYEGFEILTGAISGPLCAGNNISVPYTLNGNFPTPYSLSAQLSDASGSFATPTTIGSTTVSGPINATIPAGISTTGTGYRIRVISASPAVIGVDNGANITINPLPKVTPTSPPAICSGAATSIALTSTPAGFSFSWGNPTSTPAGVITGGGPGGGSSITQTLTNATNTSATLTYAVTVTVNGCTSPVENIIQTVHPLPVVNSASTILCSGNAISIPLTSPTGGVTFSWPAPISGGAITGGAAGSGIIINQTLINTTTSPANITYSVTATYSTCSGPTQSITATVNPTPTVVITSPAGVCSPNTVDLSATGIKTGSTPGLIFTYYTDAAATIALGSFTAVATSGTYYIKGTTTPNCYDIKPVTVAINPKPTVITVNPSAVCSPSTIDLTANAVTTGSTPGLIYAYYTNAGATTLLGSPASVGTTGTYYIEGTTPQGCSDTTSVVVSVNPLPTISGTTPAARCGTGTIILGATAGGTISWFNVSTGGTSLGTGTSFTTPSISTTTTYYVEATQTGCTTPTRTTVVATVNPIPTITSTTPGAVCGSGTASLGAAASAGTISWFSVSTAGTSLGTGTSFTTPSISSTTTYYVEATQTGCTTPTRTAVVATVNTIPSITGTSPAARCGTGTLGLGAASGAGTISWFSVSTAGTALGTGTSFTTPSISATTTYYVEATQTGCTTPTRTAVVATINAIPTITSTTPGAVCGSGTVSLGAAASAGTISWFSVSTAGTSLGTGTSFTTPSISTTTTYYVEATQTGCTTPTRTAVVATVNAIPTITSTTPGAVCGSGTVSLGAAPSAGTISWFSVSTAGTSLGTGTSFTTPSISSTTTYYVEATQTGCTTPTRTAVVATVNSIPTVTGITPAAICGTGTANLGATASAGIISWFSVSTAGTSLGTGTSFTTPSISSTTTYYVEATQTGCTTPTRTAVVATVNSIPTVTGITPAAICGTGTANLGATASAGIISWFSVSTAGTSLGTGTSFTTPSISSTTTYYVEATQTGCTTPTRIAVVATVNTIPTITGTTPGSICGAGTVNLGATASAGTISWFSVSTAGTTVGTGTSFTSPSISATTTYYVETTQAGCTSPARTAVIATVTPGPSITGTTPSSICGSGTVTLGATASAGTISWFNVSTAGAAVGTGTSFTSPSISATTTYYVETTFSGCTTPRTAVIATVNPIPSITGSTPASICGTGTATLGATASAGTISWFTVSTAGTSINTGTSFTTPSISATTTYYIEATQSGCTTPTRTAVIATVNAIPTMDTPTPATRCGFGTVTLGASASSGTISWFSVLTAGTALGIGTSFTTPSISTTTTYYVEATQSGCTTPSRTSVVATVNNPVISPAILGSGTPGTPYSQTFTVSNMVSPTWTSSGTLPSGLAFSSGVLGGTPVSNSTSTFDITAIEGTCSVTKTYTLTISTTSTTWNGTSWNNGNPDANKDAIIDGNYNTATPTMGPFDAKNLTVNNGSTFTIDGTATVTIGGNLINSGTISQKCTATLAVTGTKSGNAINIIQPVLKPVFLNNGRLNNFYIQDSSFAVSFGTAPVFSVSSGTLPPGLSLPVGSDTLFGVPTVPGTFSFTIKSTDGNCIVSNPTTLQILDLKSSNFKIQLLSIEKTFGDAPFQIISTSSSSAPISYSMSSTNTNSCASVNASTGMVTINCVPPAGSGNEIWVVATQSTSSQFKGSKDSVQIIVKKAIPTIVLLTLPGVIIDSAILFDYQLQASYISDGGIASYIQADGQQFATVYTTNGIITGNAVGEFNIDVTLSGTTNFTSFDTTFTFNVYDSPQAPVALPDTIFLTRKDGVLGDGTIDLLKNDHGITSRVEVFLTDIDTVNQGHQNIFFSPKVGTFELDPVTGILTVRPIKGLSSTTKIGYTITDSNGVTSSIAYLTIMIINKQDLPDLKANQVMTPNDDGKNDALFIGYTDINKNNRIVILDEAGNTVYKTSNYRNDWVGTDNNGNLLAAGVYYFVFTEEEDQNRELKGYIEIIRRSLE